LAQISTIYIPIKINRDASYIKATKGDAVFLKDCSLDVSVKNGTNGEFGVRKPNIGNILPDGVGTETPYLFKLPQGINRTIGSYEFVELSEFYWFVWNENGKHTINYMDRSASNPIKVYEGSCLGFVNDLEYSIPEQNVHIRIVWDVDDSGVKTLKEKLLKFTDGLGEVRQINVLASIATNSFSTSYFNRSECCASTTLAIQPPNECIKFSLKKDNSVLTNKIYKKNLQIACRNVYVDNRISSISPYSKAITVGFSGCNIDELSYSNYAELTIPVTNDFVDYIELFIRNCNNDWVYYDTIYKHDIKANEINDWWNRTDGWGKNNYDQVSNTIKYNFYNDKKCGIIDQSIFSNIQNDIPQASKALAVAGDRLLLANNLRDYPNLTQEQKDGFKFEIEKQIIEEPCDLPLRKVKIFMKIQGDGVTDRHPPKWNSFLFKDNNEPTVDGKYHFGGVCRQLNLLGTGHMNVADDSWLKYKQYVPSETGGFVATLNGQYTSVSRQVKMFTCGNYEEMGVYSCNVSEVTDTDGSLDDLVEQLFNGDFSILQMFEFEVPAGIYSFKVHNHNKGLNVGYQKTSTYIYGNGSYACSTNSGQATKLDYEWVVDVRNADYDSLMNGGDYIILRDCTLPQADWEMNFVNRVTEVYIYEDDLKTIPIEGVRIRPNKDSANNSNYPALITDHNGFSFYKVCKPKVGLIYAFVFTVPYIVASATNIINNFPTKFYYDIYNNCSLDLRMYDYSTTVGYKGLDHSASISALINKNVCSHIEVSGYIKDVNNVGVGGVYVFTEYNNGDYTDNDGKYTLRIHDGSFSNARNIYIGTGNGECSVAGIGCAMIPPVSYSNSIACINCNRREINITDLYVVQNNREKQDTIVGRFMIGAFAHDCFGRLQFVNKLKEIELTDYDEVNKIKWSYNGVALPSKYRKLSFCITENLNGSIIEWSADSVKFLDINGAVTNNIQDASYISFDISSLINYNKAHDFGTNLLYQYVEGDMLTILSDGKKDLAIPITVKMTGATIESANQNNVNVFVDNSGSSSGSQLTEGETLTGNKIIIPFDSKYTFLENSCSVKIRITRPYKCEKEINNYYELCNIYDINNGILSANSGYLDFANSYKITRTISIKDCISSGNSKVYNSNFKNDFVNPSCTLRGRINIENPYAENKWIENEIAESDSWVNGGAINGLSSFRTENRHNTKSQQYGGIVALQAQRNIILAICRNDWFTCNYDMRYVKVGENGNVEAPLDSRISEPNQKIGSMYGCEFKHKSSIVFYDDFAMWYDSKNHKFVGCSYKDISDVSMDGVSSYFIDKTNYLNNNNSVEVLAGICPKTNKIDITFRDNKLDKYTNNNMDVIVNDNETISYSAKYKMWNEFKGYIPEYYGKLRDSKLGELQITFKHGYPYLHNTNLANICEYFGEKVRPIISFVVNEEPTAEKNFQAIAQNIKGQNLILEQVHTEAWNSYSYIPQAYWIKKQDIIYAELLRDMTGYFDPNKPQIISQLIDGKRIVGKWVFLRFTVPMDKAGQYFELDSILIQMAKSELTSKNTSQ
jgi:hypothetical protein